MMQLLVLTDDIQVACDPSKDEATIVLRTRDKNRFLVVASDLATVLLEVEDDHISTLTTRNQRHEHKSFAFTADEPACIALKPCASRFERSLALWSDDRSGHIYAGICAGKSFTGAPLSPPERVELSRLEAIVDCLTPVLLKNR